MPDDKEVPRLPVYPPPQPPIQRPGALGKMMSKMMKMPKAHMPRHKGLTTTKSQKFKHKKGVQFY